MICNTRVCMCPWLVTCSAPSLINWPSNHICDMLSLLIPCSFLFAEVCSNKASRPSCRKANYITERMDEWMDGGGSSVTPPGPQRRMWGYPLLRPTPTSCRWSSSLGWHLFPACCLCGIGTIWTFHVTIIVIKEIAIYDIVSYHNNLKYYIIILGRNIWCVRFIKVLADKTNITNRSMKTIPEEASVKSHRSTL